MEPDISRDGKKPQSAHRSMSDLIAVLVLQGHNFGAIHDCTSGCSLSGACCPLNSGACDAGQRYIMNPSTSSEDPQTNFSPCSIGNICSLMQSNALDYSCMVPPGGRTVLSLQSCGSESRLTAYLDVEDPYEYSRRWHSRRWGRL
jgi:hypothetical protein